MLIFLGSFPAVVGLFLFLIAIHLHFRSWSSRVTFLVSTRKPAEVLEKLEHAIINNADFKGILMAGNVTAVKLRRFVDSAPEIPTGILHHQGKDVGGYYPGQLARVYVAYPPEARPKLFTKLQPIPVKQEIEPLHEFDHHILKQYIHYHRKMKVHDWHTQTTYREAFTLPVFKLGSADDYYRPRTEAESLSVWKSVSAKRRGGKPSFMGV